MRDPESYHLSLLQLIRSDLEVNKRNPKGFFVVLMYRIAHATLRLPRFISPIRYAILFLYKLITEYIVGTEIHWRAEIGSHLCVFHGYGLVINSHSRLGTHVVLRHGVTIGAKGKFEGDAPQIGNGVEFGASSMVIGQVTVGDGAFVGAGAVVVNDVPAGAVVVGNPAKILRSDRGEINGA